MFPSLKKNNKSATTHWLEWCAAQAAAPPVGFLWGCRVRGAAYKLISTSLQSADSTTDLQTPDFITKVRDDRGRPRRGESSLCRDVLRIPGCDVREQTLRHTGPHPCRGLIGHRELRRTPSGCLVK